MRDGIDICYLCGELLDQKNISDEHIPPRQIYARDIRKNHDLSRLITLPTHKACNQSYQKDEDYFVVSLAPFVVGSYTGRAVFDDILQQLKREEGRRLFQKSLDEFGKVILPNGWMVKGLDPVRIPRIFWKIIRGLFFFETKRFLPENTPWFINVFGESFLQESPPLFSYVRNTPSRGKYTGAFDYKYNKISVADQCHLWLWAMLFWDSIICMIGFPDPEHSVEDCRKVFENLR